MALDSRYIPFYNIAQFIWDKNNALPLTAGIVKFWVDEQRMTPKEVFRLTGISPAYTYTSLGAVLTLGATGAFIDGSNTPIVIYAFPYDAMGNIQRYYIEVFDMDGNSQFVVEAAPYVFQTELPPDAILTGGNELNNSQFVEVSFNPQDSHIYNFTSAMNQEVQLAPDWILIASGTGSVTVQRIALTELNTPTNPPYVIDINSTGISTLTVTQRLTNSPRLIANGFVSGYFIAASQDSLAHALQMEYNPSGGTLDSNIIIDQTITSDGSYNILQGNLDVTGIISSDPATTGYVDIDIVIPIGAHLRISSFQLVQVNAPINIAYGQQSTQKQINTLFSYYKNSMQYMPKQSLIPWWKMEYNPKQINNADGTVVSQCGYIYDQTIFYQTSASNFIVNLGPIVNNGTLDIYPVADAVDARFALITYLAPKSIQGWWGYWMSVLTRALLTTTHNTTCRIKVRIIWRATLPSTLSSAEPIASWAPGTDPTFSAGWTAIAPLNDPAYDLNIAVGNDAGNMTFPAFPFDQMQLPIPTAADSNMIGLVFYTFDPLNSTSGSQDIINIDSISLVPNQFAVDGTAFTASEVLQATRYYVESSYPYGIALGTSSTIQNSILAYQRSLAYVASSTVPVVPSPFNVAYMNKCLPQPAITLYSPTTGTSGDLDVVGWVDGNTNTTAVTVTSAWAPITAGSSNTYYISENPAANTINLAVAGGTNTHETSAFVSYHFLVNSQLGQ